MTKRQVPSGGEANYARSLRGLFRGLLTGALDQFGFIDLMYTAVTFHISGAWAEGAARAGIKPDELSPAEIAERDAFIIQQTTHIVSVSEWIIARHSAYMLRKQPTINIINARVQLWVNQYDAARVQAETMARADQKMVWKLGHTKEHCKSCTTFHGRVYRASTWHAHGALPHSQRLCCNGFQCGCTLSPTTQPMSKGRFPEGALCH